MMSPGLRYLANVDHQLDRRNKGAHPRLLSTSGSDAQGSYVGSGWARYGEMTNDLSAMHPLC